MPILLTGTLKVSLNPNKLFSIGASQSSQRCPKKIGKFIFHFARLVLRRNPRCLFPDRSFLAYAAFPSHSRHHQEPSSRVRHQRFRPFAPPRLAFLFLPRGRLRSHPHPVGQLGRFLALFDRLASEFECSFQSASKHYLHPLFLLQQQLRLALCVGERAQNCATNCSLERCPFKISMREEANLSQDFAKVLLHSPPHIASRGHP